AIATNAPRGAELKLPGPEDSLAQSLTHTVQFAWTEEVLDLLRRFAHVSRNICIVGGCALNGVTNHAIEQEGLFERTHFLPNPTDCGLSAGAALHAYYALSGSRFDGYGAYFTPYLGTEPFDRDGLPSLKQRYPHRALELDDEALAGVVASLVQRDLI